MAVREFNGTSDRIVCDNGVIGQLANGALTMMVLVYPLALGGTRSHISAVNGSNWVAALQQDGGTGNGALTDDNDFSSGAAGLAANVWQIYAVTLTAPSAQPRLHRKQLGTGSWTRTNVAAWAGNAISAATVEFASTNNGSFSSFFNGRLAVGAIWNSALSDGTLDTIESTATTQGVYATTPQGLWEFNQASVATDVTDLMGNGANQTAISGTTVVNGSDPTWTFGLSTSGLAWIRA